LAERTASLKEEEPRWGCKVGRNSGLVTKGEVRKAAIQKNRERAQGEGFNVPLRPAKNRVSSHIRERYTKPKL